MEEHTPTEILFVDDDDAIRVAFERTLIRLGMAVDVARDPWSAMKLAKRNSYSVVVTDFALPGLDGLALSEELERMQPAASFILLSGQLDLKLATAAVNEHNFTGVLLKPWKIDELHSIINRALEISWERQYRRRLMEPQVRKASTLDI